MLGCSKDIPIYTMKHNEFAENTPDIVVPKQIAARVNLDYHQINDVDLTDKDIAEADGLLGEGNYSKRTLMLAHTINKHFGIMPLSMVILLGKWENVLFIETFLYAMRPHRIFSVNCTTILKGQRWLCENGYRI